VQTHITSSVVVYDGQRTIDTLVVIWSRIDNKIRHEHQGICPTVLKGSNRCIIHQHP